MSGGVSAGTMFAYAAAAVGGALAAKAMSKTPGMPQIQEAIAPPQVSKAANNVVKRTGSAATGLPSQAVGTLLTGATGVDPGALALGRNTLLGQ